MPTDLIRRIREWTKLRDDAARLRRLDDHLLADMGIERDQIDGFVLGKVEKPADGVLPEWAERPRRSIVRVPQIGRSRHAAVSQPECVPAE